MIETKEMAIARWESAARRADRNGQPSVAITYRNMAWLVANAHTWIPTVVKTAGEQVKAYIEQMEQSVKE